MMLCYSQDDCSIPTNSQFHENIDYMSANDISNFHLHQCWKENNSLSVKKSQDDICSKIPSSVSRRLENVAWRRMYKQICNLDEASPASINWNKNQDITWLFGPKYNSPSPFDDAPLTSANLSKFAIDDLSDSMVDEVSSVASARSMSFDDRSSIESSDDIEEDQDHCCADLKSVLKSERRLFAREKKHRKKRVKFDYIVNSREFMNGLSLDYSYLDPSCL